MYVAIYDHFYEINNALIRIELSTAERQRLPLRLLDCFKDPKTKRSRWNTMSQPLPPQQEEEGEQLRIEEDVQSKASMETDKEAIASNNNDSLQNQQQQQQQREGLVLAELSAVVNTLSSISEVLDDIVRLTNPPSIPKKSESSPTTTAGSRPRNSTNTGSIAAKQFLLLEELHKWKDVTR